MIASKSVALGSEIRLTPVDTDVKMDVHKMFIIRPGRLLNVYQGRLEVQRGIYNFSNLKLRRAVMSTVNQPSGVLCETPRALHFRLLQHPTWLKIKLAVFITS